MDAERNLAIWLMVLAVVTLRLKAASTSPTTPSCCRASIGAAQGDHLGGILKNDRFQEHHGLKDFQLHILDHYGHRCSKYHLRTQPW